MLVLDTIWHAEQGAALPSSHHLCRWRRQPGHSLLEPTAYSVPAPTEPPSSSFPGPATPFRPDGKGFEWTILKRAVPFGCLPEVPPAVARDPSDWLAHH